MSVKLDLYNLLQPRLAAIQGVETVRIWNNQPDNEPREQAFRYPAIFMEYQIDWQPQTAGGLGFQGDKIGSSQQNGLLTLTLHICFSRLENETDIFPDVDALVYEAHKAVVLADYRSVETIGFARRLSESQDNDHDRVSDWQVAYEFVVTELPIEKEGIQQWAPEDDQGNPAGITIVGTLKIDPTSSGGVHTDGV